MYDAQKGIAERTFRRSARRQLSAAQARLAREGSWGEGVCDGRAFADADADADVKEGRRERERVRRVRRVWAIVEGFLVLVS